MVERAQHFRKQGRHLASSIRRAKSQPDNLQTDICAAAFVGDWKSITSETDFAALDQADTDRTGTSDNDRPLRATVSAKTGSHAVAYEVNRNKRMRDPFKRSFRASTPNTGEADSSVQPRKILALQSGLCGCRFGGFHDGPPGLLDADPRGGWSRDPFAELPTISVFDTSPAATATPVNSEVTGILLRHRGLPERLHSGSW